MIDANDPTSYGTDTVYVDDEKEQQTARAEKVKRDGPKVKRPKDVTIIVEDKVWGNLGHDQPVLLQHGHHLDSQVWLREKKVGKPLPLQLFDAGYDVWLGNNRGSYNCQLQTGRMSQKPQRDIWDWSYPEMAKFDLPAFILKIKEQTGFAKVAYVGYDQGATQMLYGLAHWEATFFKQHLSKVILMAPCAKPKVMDIEKIFAGYKNVF